MDEKHRFIFARSLEKTLKGARVSGKQQMAMEQDILNGLGVIAPHTGGIRKIRCAAGGKGKRGSLRVAYAHYPAKGRTYLLQATQKSKQTDFTPEEYKALRAIKARLDAEIKKLK